MPVAVPTKSSGVLFKRLMCTDCENEIHSVNLSLNDVETQ